MDDEIELEYSKHNGKFTRDGVTLTIAIYRGKGDEGRWILEVENEAGGSTVWEETFSTENDAWDEFLATVQREGIEQFVFDDDTDMSVLH